MGSLARLSAVVSLALLAALILVLPTVLRAEEKPVTLEDAMATATNVVKSARQATRGDAKTVADLATARAALTAWADDVRTAHWRGPSDQRNDAFAAVWNELLTVSRYHGQKFDDDYVIDRLAIIWDRLLIGMPACSTWSYTRLKPPFERVFPIRFVQQRPGGERLRIVSLKTFLWKEDYEGVAGSDGKLLARNGLKADRNRIKKKGRKNGKRVRVVRLNDEFVKVHSYFLEGEHSSEDRRVRLEGYYLKGDQWTCRVRIETFLDPAEGDDDVTAWQMERTCPELAALLGSAAQNPATKGK